MPRIPWGGGLPLYDLVTLVLGNYPIVRRGGQWVSWPMCSQCHVSVARSHRQSCCVWVYPTASTRLCCGVDGGKQVCTSEALFFLVGLDPMNTDHLGWKVFLLFLNLLSEHFTSWRAIRGWRPGRFLRLQICLVVAVRGMLPPFALLLCSLPCAQTQCVLDA